MIGAGVGVGGGVADRSSRCFPLYPVAEGLRERVGFGDEGVVAASRVNLESMSLDVEPVWEGGFEVGKGIDDPEGDRGVVGTGADAAGVVLGGGGTKYGGTSFSAHDCIVFRSNSGMSHLSVLCVLASMSLHMSGFFQKTLGPLAMMTCKSPFICNFCLGAPEDEATGSDGLGDGSLGAAEGSKVFAGFGVTGSG